jgi:hypothetical protein
MIRTILQPLELILQKYEKKTLFDLLKELPESQTILSEHVPQSGTLSSHVLTFVFFLAI